MSDGFWAFAPYGDISEYIGDFDTRQEAEDAANEHYAEDIIEYNDARNGEYFDNIYTILYIEDIPVEYEHYHGDLKEHGLTMRDVL